MHRFIIFLSNVSPSPTPDTGLDNSKVQPGAWYGIILTSLIVALIILLRSMNRHLKRVNFETKDEL